MLRPRHGVLLDEPALGLDTYHKSLLLRVLRALAATGQVVAFSTHDIELAAQADRLILLGASRDRRFRHAIRVATPGRYMGGDRLARSRLGGSPMLNRGARRQMYRLVLIEASPLRRVDPASSWQWGCAPRWR